MVMVSQSSFRTNKTLLAIAICMLCIGQTHAENKPKTISLIKKPISLVSVNKKKGAKVKADTIKEPSITNYSDIARVLNQVAGVYAINRLPNDNSPIISHHTDPLSPSIMLMSDGINWGPLPFYLSSISQITPLFLSNGLELDSASNSAFASQSVSSIVGYRPEIRKVGDVELHVGTNNQRGFKFDSGDEKGQFGHRLIASKQQVDSHRKFNGGEKGSFDSNEILLKLRENSVVNSGKNKQNTQVLIHYKDFENNESYVGLSAADKDIKPLHRYQASQLDYLSGDDLLLGLTHNTAMFSGESVKTDVFYRRGNIQNYQTNSINGLGAYFTPDILSQFESSPSGELLVNKKLVDSIYTTIGVRMDIEQQLSAHTFNVGFEYHQEEIEQATSNDRYRFDAQLALTLDSLSNDHLLLDSKARTKSFYITDRWKNGDLSIDAGVKYLTMNDRREDVNAKLYSRINDNNTLYNLTLNYDFSPEFSAFISAKKGVQAYRSMKTPQLARSHTQMALGAKYVGKQSYLSLTGFYREFDNSLERCPLLESCITQDKNETDINISAIELSGGYVASFNDITMPMSFTYSQRNAQYTQAANAINSNIATNDKLAFLPEKQFSMSIGAQFETLYLETRIQYRGRQRLIHGQSSFAFTSSLDGVTVVDLMASYQLSDTQQLSLSIENTLDEEYTEHAMYRGYMAARKRFSSLKYKIKF